MAYRVQQKNNSARRELLARMYFISVALPAILLVPMFTVAGDRAPSTAFRVPQDPIEPTRRPEAEGTTSDSKIGEHPSLGARPVNLCPGCPFEFRFDWKNFRTKGSGINHK